MTVLSYMALENGMAPLSVLEQLNKGKTNEEIYHSKRNAHVFNSNSKGGPILAPFQQSFHALKVLFNLTTTLLSQIIRYL